MMVTENTNRYTVPIKYEKEPNSTTAEVWHDISPGSVKIYRTTLEGGTERTLMGTDKRTEPCVGALITESGTTFGTVFYSSGTIVFDNCLSYPACVDFKSLGKIPIEIKWKDSNAHLKQEESKNLCKRYRIEDLAPSIRRDPEPEDTGLLQPAEFSHFEVGGYYRHGGGMGFHIITAAKMKVHGWVFIAETEGGQLRPLDQSADAIQGWIQISEGEWKSELEEKS